jgi:ribosome biogenesis GTPase / thiamine phosphate phosphatase
MILSQFGWNSHCETLWNALDRGSHFPARVVEVQKNAWRLVSEHGSFFAQLSGRLRHLDSESQNWPAVGDWVETADGVIFDVLRRWSKLSRKAAGRRTEEQIIAANIDTVFVVTSLDRDLNVRRLERYLTMIWEGGARPVIILNKADVCDDVERLRAELEESMPGVPAYAISARTGLGLDQFSAYLRSGDTIVLVGSSGVGKSTLMNRLCGHDLQTVNTVLEDGRGRHTTTSRNLILLPSGALLIDTPGMRELQLWASEDTLGDAFEEIEELAQGCRFRDCRHVAEPGCAVLEAVEQGQISEDRFDSYTKLRKEVAFLNRKQDHFAELEHKRKWKRLHKAHKAMYKRRKD